MLKESYSNFSKQETPLVNEALNLAILSLPRACQNAASHIINSGGKRLRPLLVILFARMFGYADKNIYNLSISMELLHAATLLHDDILDSASKRRGNDTAHQIYGSKKTILSGDALLAYGNAIVASYNKPDLCSCFSHATSETAAGEIMEMELLHNPDLSEADYLAMITGKTACLLADSCCLGAIIANAEKSMLALTYEFGKNLGIAFQIIDDAMDFLPEQITGKAQAGDLKEGKLTPPLRFYRESLSGQERNHFDNLFITGKFSASDIEKIIDSMQEFTDKTRSYAVSFLQLAQLALTSFPDSAEKDILEDIILNARHRNK